MLLDTIKPSLYEIQIEQTCFECYPIIVWFKGLNKSHNLTDLSPPDIINRSLFEICTEDTLESCIPIVLLWF